MNVREDSKASIAVQSFSASIGSIDNFQYGVFGELQSGNTSIFASPFGFTGRWGGYTDGRLSQVLNWNRWYGPEAGRWGSKNPIGIRGGQNYYEYSKNNSINKIDTTGFFSVDPRCIYLKTKMAALSWAIFFQAAEYYIDPRNLVMGPDPGDLCSRESRSEHLQHLRDLQTKYDRLSQEYKDRKCGDDNDGPPNSPATSPAPSPGFGPAAPRAPKGVNPLFPIILFVIFSPVGV